MQRVKRRWEGHNGIVLCVAISENGRRIMSGSDDRTARVWNIESGLLVGEPFEDREGPVRCVGVSEDGRWMVSGSDDLKVRVWNVNSREKVGEYEHHRYILRLRFRASVMTDVDDLQVCSFDGVERPWDVGKKECIAMSNVSSWHARLTKLQFTFTPVDYKWPSAN